MSNTEFAFLFLVSIMVHNEPSFFARQSRGHAMVEGFLTHHSACSYCFAFSQSCPSRACGHVALHSRYLLFRLINVIQWLTSLKGGNTSGTGAMTSLKHWHHHSHSGTNWGSVIGSPSRWRQSGSIPDNGLGQCLGKDVFSSACWAGFLNLDIFANFMAVFLVSEGLRSSASVSQVLSGTACLLPMVRCRQDNNTYPKKLKFCEFIPHKYKLNWDIRMDIRRKRIPA